LVIKLGKYFLLQFYITLPLRGNPTTPRVGADLSFLFKLSFYSPSSHYWRSSVSHFNQSKA
jgi:hypothetical protein